MYKAILIAGCLLLSAGCTANDSLLTGILGNKNNTNINNDKSTNIHLKVPENQTLQQVHKLDKKVINNRYKIRSLSGKVFEVENQNIAYKIATLDNVLFKLDKYPKFLLFLNVRIAFDFCKDKDIAQCRTLKTKQAEIIDIMIDKFQNKATKTQITTLLSKPIN